jgi:hypothetical protein
MDQWSSDFLMRSPMFEPLRPLGAALRSPQWPTLDDLQRLADEREPMVSTRSGAPLRFVEQGARAAAFEDKYEVRIYLKGEVQIRAANWHDLLNALVWLTFPRAKAALNERHYLALRKQQAAGAPNRGPEQDVMTLFDEGGVIVVAGDDELLAQIREFRWKELFWRNRTRVESEMHFFLFGHALYEKALRPFTGITGRGLLFQSEPGFFSATPTEQIERLDAMLAQRLLDAAALKTTRDLAPVPILGVPGWCEDNAREPYYDNVEYFRPGRVPGPQ